MELIETKKKLIGVTKKGDKEYTVRQTVGIYKCICGNFTTAPVSDVKRGKVKSCGCLKGSTGGIARHGDSGKPLYKAWQAIKARCKYSSHLLFWMYGKRGLTVSSEWVSDYVAFREWAISNGYTDNMYIHLKDFSKGYSPDNCFLSTDMDDGAYYLKHKRVLRKFDSTKDFA